MSELVDRQVELAPSKSDSEETSSETEGGAPDPDLLYIYQLMEALDNWRLQGR